MVCSLLYWKFLCCQSQTIGLGCLFSSRRHPGFGLLKPATELVGIRIVPFLQLILDGACPEFSASEIPRPAYDMGGNRSRQQNKDHNGNRPCDDGALPEVERNATHGHHGPQSTRFGGGVHAGGEDGQPQNEGARE